MAATTTAVSQAPEVGVAPIPRWGFVLLLAAVGVLWLVTFEGGPVSEAIGQAGSFFHELFHDGRHLIGVPCH
ncbi:MAG TPA: CbtB-domain containing protein [Acidimicrobiales bacterium]|nr:CbtB-domain containing protein [Acidimicrobiales bacterium]